MTGSLALAAEGGAARRGAPVSCHSRQPAALTRLVCFPHAGGGPMTFRSWAEGLAPDVELWTVTLPGRAARAREHFAREWPPVVDELATAVLECVDPPLALFGHSLGAALAFEVARELTRRGEAPAHLVVSARGAPHLPQRLEVPDDDEALLRQVGLLYGGVPERVRAAEDLLGRFLPILRADAELARAYAYRAGSPLNCPITALAGDADPTVSGDELEAWRRQTLSSFEAHVLPGGHFYLVDHEDAVLEAIRRRLAVL